jgi:regulator of replication initiation timing
MHIKVVTILIAVFLIATGCISCNREVKGLREEIRLLKEENSFLKAENISLKKEMEELYKKLDEGSSTAGKEPISQKVEAKDAAKAKEESKVEEGVKKKR